MLDLYKLSIFVQVAEHGSFSRAAEHLYMTQSGVSQHIQELEASLGVRLFLRDRRGVTPTASGHLLLDYATTIMSLASEAEAVVADLAHSDQTSLNIGATPGVSVYLLPEWLDQFQRSYPDLSISVQTATTEHVAHELLRDQLNLGFMEGELDESRYAGLEYVNLQDVEQVIVVGHTHAWSGHESVTLADLHEQALVVRQAHSQTREWLNQIFQQHSIQPRIVAELDNPESIKRMVLSGRCFAIMPEYAVRREYELGLMHVIPVRDYTMQRTLKLAWKRSTSRSPVVRAFLRIVQKQFPQMQLPTY